MISLRPYQLEMVERTRDVYRHGFRAPIDVLSTGGGKSMIAAFMAYGSFQKGRQTWFLAHRTELLHQLRKTVDKAGVPCGIVGEDYKDQPCLVGNIHTVVNRLADLPKPGFIFNDECHRTASATYSRILEYHAECPRLGLSATPQRLDGRGLDSHFDCLVQGPSMKWMIAEGYLKKPRYIAPKGMVDASNIRRIGGDFDSGELEALMAKPSVTGNAVEKYLQYASGRTAIAFCVTVAHAEAVAKAFCEAGVPAESVDGKMSKAERKARLTRLATGETRIITSCELISEGFDLQSAVDVETREDCVVSAVIGLAPTHSLGKFMQRGGRGLRPGSHPDCIYLDHAGDLFRHLLLEVDREWSLQGRPKRGYVEPTLEVHRCEACYAVFMGSVCPQCGEGRKSSPRELKQREDEMREIFEVQQRVNHKAEERACDSYGDWKALGQRRGNDPRWAEIRWKMSWKSKRKPKLETV